LGAFPQISLSAVRQKREEAKRQIAKDIDPGVARKEKKAAEIREQETFENVAREWHNQFKSKWAPKMAKAILEMLTHV